MHLVHIGWPQGGKDLSQSLPSYQGAFKLSGMLNGTLKVISEATFNF